MRILLDLFCCGGGASRGYAAAGFIVVGVDIAPQPNYPYRFIQADALEFVARHGQRFNAIHASPPCQGYSTQVRSTGSQWTRSRGRAEPQLIDACRAALQATGKPYVIENVAGARQAMNVTLELCGTMFGLPIARHRLFESNVPLPQPRHVPCTGVGRAYAAKMGWEERDMRVAGKGRRAGTSERWVHILGLPAGTRMTQHQLAESIPPAYTRYIGRHLLRALPPVPTVPPALRRLLAG